MNQIPRDQRESVFLRAWTTYEARLKAAGVGLGAVPERARHWPARSLPAPPGYTATLVSVQPVTIRTVVPACPVRQAA